MIKLQTDNHLIQVKVLQKAFKEYSAILSTCTKLPPIFKTIVLSILNGRLRQVLLYCILELLSLFMSISFVESLNSEPCEEMT